MKGDFSRSTFDSKKHYSSVRLQQGRVSVDADWNEEMDIVGRRCGVETIDVVGACGAPKHAAGFELLTDPNGLAAADRERLERSGALPLKPGDFIIGAGRYYAGGQLAENEAAVTFATQPDLPSVQPIGSGGVYVAYLDVWQRHMTAVEDPAIRESALGGPDTATRTRTVWQVRLRQVGKEGESFGCGDPISWPPAGTAKLTARTEPSPPGDNPCVVPPGSGYRRLENQLYRIEIHRGSTEAGGPTFKWSRDNGSIVVEVDQFSVDGDSHRIQVRSLGRDTVLGLRQFDWIEVLDDDADLLCKAGTLAQIKEIDRARSILKLDRSISGYDAGKHAKVRRWDSAGDLAVETPVANDGYLKIEDGLEVRFGAGTVNCGDYWLIPARTVPGRFGDIQWPRTPGADPIPQPAQHIVHHRCRLGVISAKGGEKGIEITDIDDCRKVFPPLTELPAGGRCCCTVTVGDGVNSQGDYTDIQAAIEALPETGGRVCVLPGNYRLGTTAVLEKRRRVAITGCSSGTIILGPDSGPAIRITGCRGILIEDLTVLSDGPPAAVLAESTSDLRIEGCTIDTGSRSVRVDAARGATRALAVDACTIVEIRGNRIRGLPAIEALAQFIEISDNVCEGGGIWLRSRSAGVEISGNRIGHGRGPGIRLGDIGVDEEATRRMIRMVLAQTPELGEVRISSPAAGRKASFSGKAHGGYLHTAAERGLSAVSVFGNEIQDMGGCGITTLSGNVDAEELFSNGDVEDLVIRGNQVLRCVQDPPDIRLAGDVQVAGGIVLGAATRLAIVGNTVRGCGAAEGADPESAHPAFGIAVIDCAGVELAGNTIADNGSATPAGGGRKNPVQAGVAALLVYGNDLDISDFHAGQAQYQPGRPALRVHQNLVACPAGPALLAVAAGSVMVDSNTLTSNDILRLPALLGMPAILLSMGASVTVFNLGRLAALSNSMAGFGVKARVQSVAAGAPVTQGTPDGRTRFEGNQVTLTVADERAGAPSAVALFSLDDVSVQSNQVVSLLASRRLFTDGVTLGATVRSSGNNFTERFGTVLMSYLSWALLNSMTGNTAIHCMFALGGKTADVANLPATPDENCEAMLQALVQKG